MQFSATNDHRTVLQPCTLHYVSLGQLMVRVYTYSIDSPVSATVAADIVSKYFRTNGSLSLDEAAIIMWLAWPGQPIRVATRTLEYILAHDHGLKVVRY